MIKQLCIFGVGLIGGSLAKALKEKHYCEHIIGCSRNEAHLQKAIELGVIDDYCLEPKKAVQNADVILLAVPMGAMKTLLATIKPDLPPHTIITDAGSTKASIVNDVHDVFGEDFDRFVPGHPIAGREKSGVDAAISDLYHDRRVILTPLPHTDEQAVQRIQAMWQATGAIVEQLSVDAHDQILAATSHLPHFLAFNLVHTLAHLPENDDIFRYAAGGFKDFTRIASSDPVMWRDIGLHNKEALLTMINHYQTTLAQLATRLEKDDSEGLLQTFSDAKQARDTFLAKFNSR